MVSPAGLALSVEEFFKEDLMLQSIRFDERVEHLLTASDSPT
jgi:hypothetical protein